MQMAGIALLLAKRIVFAICTLLFRGQSDINLYFRRTKARLAEMQAALLVGGGMPR